MLFYLLGGIIKTEDKLISPIFLKGECWAVDLCVVAHKKCILISVGLQVFMMRAAIKGWGFFISEHFHVY